MRELREMQIPALMPGMAEATKPAEAVFGALRMDSGDGFTGCAPDKKFIESDSECSADLCNVTRILRVFGLSPDFIDFTCEKRYNS